MSSTFGPTASRSARTRSASRTDVVVRRFAEDFVGPIRARGDDHLQTRLTLSDQRLRDFDQLFGRVAWSPNVM